MYILGKKSELFKKYRVKQINSNSINLITRKRSSKLIHNELWGFGNEYNKEKTSDDELEEEHHLNYHKDFVKLKKDFSNVI